MIVGIDGTCWHNKRGFGRYTRSIIAALAKDRRGHRLKIFFDGAAPDLGEHEGVELVKLSTRTPVTQASVAGSRRRLSDLWAARRTVAREPIDVMYFPAVYSWYPTGKRAPVVVTVHDAIAERFPDLIFSSLADRVAWTLKIRLARRSADRITTVSEAARREIATYWRIPRDRIEVISEAADPMFAPVRDAEALAGVRKRLGLPEGRRFILYVGGIAPHKNLIGLIGGFEAATANPQMDDVDLVIGGDPAGDGFRSNYREVVERAEQCPALRARTFFPGFVREEDLASLYSAALALAMPAHSEGFGLPAAEAVACGTPILATAGGAVAEAAGDAGIYFDPASTASIGDAIARVGTDAALLAELKRACPPRAAAMSWERSASALYDLLERVGRA